MARVAREMRGAAPRYHAAKRATFHVLKSEEDRAAAFVAEACECGFHRLARGDKDCLSDEGEVGPTEHLAYLNEILMDQYLTALDASDYARAALIALRISKMWMLVAAKRGRQQLLKDRVEGRRQIEVV